jgi:hypothetical protein
MEAIHAICGLVAAFVVATIRVSAEDDAFEVASAPPTLYSTVVSAASACAVELAFCAPFTLGYFGSRQLLRLSTLSHFMRCSIQGGMVTLYNERKFQLVTHEVKQFSEQRGDFLNSYKPRCVLAARLAPLRSGDEFSGSGDSKQQQQQQLLVLNVHMNLGADSLRRSQMSEVVDLAATADSSEGTATSVVIAGDFNAYEHMPTVTGLAEDGFVDCVAQSGAGERETWLATNPLTHGTCSEPDGRIDYIFFRPAMRAALRSRVTRTVFNTPPWISDHFGVLAIFEAGPVHSAPAFASSDAAEATMCHCEGLEEVAYAALAEGGLGISSGCSTDTLEDEVVGSDDDEASSERESRGACSIRSGSDSGGSLLLEPCFELDTIAVPCQW